MISHLGLYDVNDMLTRPKPPNIIIPKSSKHLTTQSLSLPILSHKNKSSLHKEKKRLYKKGEYEDGRLMFARVMKEIEEKVSKEERNDDINRVINPKLDYIYFRDNEYLKSFHNNMKKGFDQVKRTFQTIKLIHEDWKKNMYA